MPDDLDLMQLAASGELLATVDGVAYRAASMVFADDGGVPRIYCRHADWPTTPAARLFATSRELAELAEITERHAAEVVRLSRRVAELERQLARPAETPVQNQERMFRAQQAAQPPPPDPVSCPDCRAAFKNERALRMHQQRAHLGMQTQTAKAPLAQFVEPLGWHCAALGCHGAHARDLHDTAFCTLHAQRQIANGVELMKEM